MLKVDELGNDIGKLLEAQPKNIKGIVILVEDGEKSDSLRIITRGMGAIEALGWLARVSIKIEEKPNGTGSK